MALIRKGDDHDMAAAAGVDLELIPGEVDIPETQVEQKKLLRASVIAKSTTVVMTLALLVLWPFPMYGTSYIFSKPFFTGWVVVGIIWLFCSLFCVGLFPLWEGRFSVLHTVKAIYLDVTGKVHPSKYHAHGADITEEVTKGDGVDTPPDATKSQAPEGEKTKEMTE